MKKILTLVALGLILCLAISFALADNEEYRAIYFGPTVTHDGGYSTAATRADAETGANWRIEIIGVTSSEKWPQGETAVVNGVGAHGEMSYVTVTKTALGDSPALTAYGAIMLADNAHTAAAVKTLKNFDIDEDTCHWVELCNTPGCGEPLSEWHTTKFHNEYPELCVAHETVPATDEEPGYVRAYCTICGETLGEKEIPAGHEHVAVRVWEQYPDCLNGLTGIYHLECEECWAWMVHTEKGDELSETEIDITVKGEEALALIEEDDPYYFESIDAEGHQWNEWVLASEVDCIYPGYDIRWCEKCHAEQSRIDTSKEQNYGKPLGIQYTPVTVSCSEGTKIELVCKHCAGAYKDYKGAHIVKTSLTLDTWAKYGENGTVQKDAIVLNHQQDHCKDDLVGHKDPTCTLHGWDKYKCHNPKCIWNKNTAEPQERAAKIGDWESEARTDVDKNYYDYIIIPATGHNWTEWEFVAEQPDGEGLWRRHCTNKGCTSYERYFGYYDPNLFDTCEHPADALEIWDEVEPTCTKDGSVWYFCTACGYDWVEEIEAPGHELGEFNTLIKPTCTVDGKAVAQCKVCGEYEDKVIEATGHKNTVEVEAVAPTCMKVGYTAGVFCKDCETYIQGHVVVDVDPEAHKLGEKKTTVAATCKTEGEEIAVCELCGKAVITKTEKLAHEWGEWTETVAPTMDEDGEEERVCAKCGEKETRAKAYEPTATKYDVTELDYKSPKATGKIELVKGTKPLDKKWARVSFFLANGECMIQIVEVKDDNTFVAGAMGNYVHVSVIIIDVDDAYSAEDAIEHAVGNNGITL